MTNKSCVFYNKSFYDDLYPHTFIKEDNTYKIIYNINNKEKIIKDIIFNQSINTYIDNYQAPQTLIIPRRKNQEQAIDKGWKPIFFRAEKSAETLKNNYLTSGFTIISKNLGIESAISFEAMFQNWDIPQNGKMNTDWILTSPTNPFSPEYGIMCWIKNPNNYVNNQLKDVTIDEVAYNTVLYPKQTWTYIVGEGQDKKTITIDPDTKLIKKSNDILLISDNEKLIITATNRLAPNTAVKYFVIEELLSYLKTKNPEDETSIKDILFTIKSPTKLVHISPGDVYSYYDSEAEKNVSYTDGMSSKTYLSPVLNDIYRQIYHNLTLKIKKEFDFEKKIPKPSFNRAEDRFFKKICYFLSTHPQIDRTTVSILQHPDIYDIIKEALVAINKIKDYGPDLIRIENFILESVLILISEYFFKIITDDNVYRDPTYIIKTLINKYGSSLRFEEQSKAALKYKKPLPNGPHLKVRSDIRSLSNKKFRDSIIYNNVRINVGSYIIQTTLNNNESSLRLSTNFHNESSIIPLWDVKKITLKNEKALFTTGPDLVTTFKNPINNNSAFFIKNSSNTELSIELKAAGLLFDQTQSALAGIDIQFEWSRVSGPDCLRFSNFALTSVRNNGVFAGNLGSDLRFETSQDEQPTIYIKKPGKYTIRCRVTTLFGTITDTIVIYVTSQDADVGIYEKPRNEIPRQLREISLLSPENNAVMVSNFKEFIIGKQGIFWPIYSDLSVLEPRFISVPNPVLPGLETSLRIGNEIKPLGSLLNKFLIPYDREDETYKEIAEGLKDPSYLEFNFDLNNTVIEISQIILSNIYSESTPYCETIYREVFDHKLIDLELGSVKTFVDVKTERDIDVIRPEIIGTNKLVLSSISGDLLKEKLFNNKSIPLVFEDFKYNEEIYSRNFENISNPNNPAVCYEQYSSNNTDLSLSIPLQKGYFHPNSGWIEQKYINQDTRYNNKTSIIAGDGYKKYCKVFKGLGFNEITNDFIDGNIKLYESSIELSMSEIAYDPIEGELQALIDADKKEENDHNINYGYRDLSGRTNSLYKYNDEFLVSPGIVPDQPVSSAEYCLEDIRTKENINIAVSNTIAYQYVKPGPIYAPPRPEDNKIRYDRSFGRIIGDLEIKLNFLNYINPKELVIWLEIQAPSEIAGSISSEKSPRDALYFSEGVKRSECISFIDKIENENIKKYMNNLFTLNDHQHEPENKRKLTNSTYYLFLTNQDHIDMPSYNNIIKFTDNTPCETNNINIGEFITPNTNQARLKNGIVEINPTMSAPGFSDEDCYKYKQIIKNNNLEKYTISKFNKFINLPLFATEQPEAAVQPPPANSSNITFKLNIAVMGESGDGNVYDRIINTDNIMNINNAKLKHVSNIHSNSLCSWEIIVNNRKSLLNFEDKDALGQIDYINKEPKYLGYNFIGKVPQNLIPPANIDAPNKSIYDTSKCFYNRERLTYPTISPVPPLNISPIIYIPSFTIVGELGSAAGVGAQINNQAREIGNFLNDLRRIRLAEEFNREIYIPKFDRYPTGRSDKSLISVSKDNVIWHKLEAGILRYNNCPIIKRKKYFYKHIHHLNEFKNLAIFSLNIVKNAKALIDFKTINLKEIKAPENLKEYDLTLEIIKENIPDGLLSYIKSFILKINTEIITIEKQIETSNENEQEIPASLSDRLSGLQNLFSEYMSIYDAIGPEGIVEDSIVILQQDEITETSTRTIYENYTIGAPIDDTTNLPRLIPFTDLYTLLKHNKSLFINNTIINIQKELKTYLLQSSSDEKIEDIIESTLVTIDGVKPYTIYKDNESIDIFTPKLIFTDNEQTNLNELNEQLSQFKTQLSEEFEKPKESRDKQKISDLKKSMIGIEDQIFNLSHTKSANSIKSKAILRNQTGFQTILVLSSPVTDGSLLIIKPSDNRIIAFDTEYIGNHDGDNIINPWSFVNNGLGPSKRMSDNPKNIFNAGMYGTSSPFTLRQKLYNPETSNYIKDFIQYIDVNRYVNENFKENYTLYSEKDVKDGKMSNIFTFDNDGSKELIKKYNSYIIIKNPNAKEDIFGLLDKIMNYEQYNVFFKPDSLKFLIEGSLTDDLSDPATDRSEGYIEFENNINCDIIYGLKDYSQLSIILQRIITITDSITKTQEDIVKEEEKLFKTEVEAEIEAISEQIKKFKDIIYKLKLEYNLISFYIEKLNIDKETKLSKNEQIFPNIFLELIINSEDGSIEIQEQSNDNYYIFNIDAEQGCSLDLDKMPKILTSIEYECLTVLGPAYVDAYRFCPGFSGNESGGNQRVVGDYNVTFDPFRTKYNIIPEKLEELKTKYAHPELDWNQGSTYFSERSFFLNGNGERRGGIVKASYSYIIPKYTAQTLKPEGSLANKVKDIFNLDQINTINIDFKKINRNLRNVDHLYDRYVPTIDGLLVKSLAPPPGGRIDNSLKIWQCYGRNDGLPITLPANFSWMNLVKYMSFYNTYLINIFKDKTIDYDIFDLNNGTQNIKVRDEMGLIPYDYK